MSDTAFIFYNDSRELVVSADARGLHCIGRAALQRVVQPSGSATSPDPGRTGGYSVYRISSATPILVAIDLPLNRRVGVVNVTQPSTGVWEITCVCGDTADGDGMDATQYPLAVWAYGYPTTTSSDTAAIIWRPGGTEIAYNLALNPLFPRAFVTGTGNPISIPALTRPVVIGSPGREYQRPGRIGANTWKFVHRSGCWTRTGSATMVDGLYTDWVFQFFAPGDEEPPFEFIDDPVDTPAFLVEGALLP